jgi:hypothetical protein
MLTAKWFEKLAVGGFDYLADHISRDLLAGCAGTMADRAGHRHSAIAAIGRIYAQRSTS